MEVVRRDQILLEVFELNERHERKRRVKDDSKAFELNDWKHEVAIS